MIGTSDNEISPSGSYSATVSENYIPSQDNASHEEHTVSYEEYTVSTAPKNSFSFKNCTELKKVYPEGVKVGHPEYQEKMDRDRDGWACEPSD